jgi:hypothetical protein
MDQKHGPYKNGESFINAFETWSWKIMLKIKLTDGIANYEVFQRAKEERLLSKILKTDDTFGKGI